ncbi:hypothetical protein VKT23_003756 [Stygiomarasmius scandens]|uniref:Uncharacterized protein n=1 Tax=Marasmiellus scandens TaxID=2682957 RepID=A0ABR1K0Z7_9AGAR
MSDRDEDKHVPQFTLLVAGHRGGKSSFLRLLLDTAFVSHSASSDQLASLAKFVQGCSSHTNHIRSTSLHVDLDAPNATIALSLIDTPSLDLSDDLAAERSFADTLRFVESRLKDGLDARTGDRLVHLCIYFLDPDRIVPPSIPAPPAPRTRTNSFSDQEPVILEPPVSNNPLHYKPSLPLDDINRIRRLSARVNVLPVISRADLLCNERMSAIKIAVRRDLADAGIGFGIFDDVQENGYHPNGSSSSTNTPPPTSPTSPSLLRLPYALISPDSYSHSDGVPRISLSRTELVQFYASPRITRSGPGKYVRSYRWGTLDVLDPKHCDFVPLREAIFHHMDTLQNYTRDYLFKKFQTDFHQQPRQSLPHSLPSIAHLPHSARPILAIDTAAPHNPIPRHPVLNIPPEIAPASRNLPDGVSVKSKGTKQRSKKITVACNFCRSRKLKCDGGRPACSQCVKRSNSCDYMPQNKRRGTISRRKEGESESESGEEQSPEINDQPPSPQATSHQPMPRRGSLLEKPDLPLLPSISSLPSRSRAVTHSGVTRTFYPGPDNELPHIATLSLPDPSPSTTPIPMSAPSLPPIRPASEQQAAQRKRAATVPGKSTRTHSTSGPKVVACNFCRARKTKCDGAHPTCSSCARRSLACEYVNDRGHRASASSSTEDGRKGVGTRRPSAATKVTPATPAPDYSNLPSPPSSRMLPTPADVYDRRDIVMVDAGPEMDLKRPSEHIDAMRPTKKLRVSPMITDIP